MPRRVIGYERGIDVAGLILREDIDEVRSRVNIAEVIGAHVTLKNAGIGSMKGLCPFHEERTPSFHVRPQVGMYHCFGCGESGDVFTFLQKVDHVTFSEAVERLAGTVGIALRYEDGRAPDREAVGRRARLLDMHKVAEEFYRESLHTPGGAVAREFLEAKGFTLGDATHFGVGFAPQGWDNLLKLLRTRGYEQTELVASGLMSEGRRGIYDRFRGRLMWPIRDLTGATIGFGARRLFEDDQGPKYLNTPETVLYKKNQVLYGVDLAKRDIARSRQLVVVEGYTDVMAAHLAGVPTAVATCGTAFGTEHIKVARRLLSDDDALSGEVVFTFDGDEAGRKAALKAFDEDQRFVAQTFVAVEPHGLDPNDLRVQSGDAAVRDLIASRRPLFEFAITSTLAGIDLTTIEGRVRAVRAVAPVVAGIRDRSLRPAYARFVAGRIGVDTAEVDAAVARASRGRNQAADPQGEAAATARPAASPRDPVEQVERGALQIVLQQPGYVNARLYDALDGQVFRTSAYRAVHDAVRAAGGVTRALENPAAWPERVRSAAPEVVADLVAELSVAPLPASSPEDVERYARGIIARLFDLDMARIASALHSRLQQVAGSDPQLEGKLLGQLQTLEAQRARLRSSL